MMEEIDINKELINELEAFENIKKGVTSYIKDVLQISHLNSTFIEEMINTSEKNRTLISDLHNEVKIIKEKSENMTESVKQSLIHISNNKEIILNNTTVLNEAVSSIDELEKRFDKIQNLFTDVYQATKKVLKSIEVIEDIASLTNLLALNAAIEAARAGSYGKGFNVVAHEIRKLADKSRTTTDEIAHVVNELVSQISNTMGFMEEYKNIRKIVRDKIQKTEEGIKESVKSAETADNEMRNIAQSIEDQAVSTENIFRKITTAHTISDFMTSSSKHIINNMKYQEDVIDEIIATLTESGDYIKTQKNKLESIGIIKREKTKLFVAHDIAYPPWVYLKSGISTGISINVFKEISKIAHLNFEFTGDQWENIFPEFLQGNIDLILNVGWPNSFFDDKPVIATKSYAQFEIQIFGVKNRDTDNIVTPEQIEGKKIGVQRASYVTDYLREDCNCKIVEFENDIQGIAKLIWGEIDGVATERHVAEYLSKKYFDEQVGPTTGVLKKLDVVILLREENTELKERIDSAIEELQKGNKLTSLIENF